MSFRFIRDHADRWPTRLRCRVLEVLASGYYAWRSPPESARTAANRALLADVRLLDLATRKIIAWAMRDHMRTELPLAALMMAVQRQRPAEGLICHSDRGSQYAFEAYGEQIVAMKAKRR